MNAVDFMNMVEAHLLSYRDLGNEFVVVYRDQTHHEMLFVEAYRNYQESVDQRKYWVNHGYAIKMFYDLEHLGWLENQNV